MNPGGIEEAVKDSTPTEQTKAVAPTDTTQSLVVPSDSQTETLQHAYSYAHNYSIGK